MYEMDKEMEGVNLEEKCLLLKSADKEAAEEEEEETGDAKEEQGGGHGGGGEDVKERDGEKSSAVKLVGQVLSDSQMRFTESWPRFFKLDKLFLPQVAGKKSSWKIVEKQFIQVWSSPVV